ncbi:hypothetical protein SAMN02745830_05401 [Streptomyces sp. Amel2xC10]|nr:hypothetical protein SAMN02745830_05401 [Streptomyces sp. Amel2xC10]
MSKNVTPGSACIIHGSPEVPSYPSTQVVIVVVVAMALATTLVALGHPVAEALQVVGGSAVVLAVSMARGSHLLIRRIRI